MTSLGRAPSSSKRHERVFVSVSLGSADEGGVVSTTEAIGELRSTSFGLDRRELAGAFGDLGVFVPIAVALIVKNGLSPTAVLLPAGLLYITAGLVYRLPVPVQPLKAFGAIAIAKGLGANDIAAGALLMGAIFLALGATGLLDRVARVFPTALIRGIQLTVGLLFLKIAWGLVSVPPKSFSHQPASTAVLVSLGLLALALAFALKRHLITLVFVAAAAVVMLSTAGGHLALGPSAISFPTLDGATFWTALTVLVIPQAPLSFANSCLATADVAKTYFGKAAERVRPGRLAMTLGSANLLAGAISGMPVCHGAGGMTAHYWFGARRAGAPLAIGSALIALALLVGTDLTGLLTAFPLPILAGLLATAGLLHIGLLRDLRGARDWTLALASGSSASSSTTSRSRSPADSPPGGCYAAHASSPLAPPQGREQQNSGDPPSCQACLTP
jgi:SulP family sulfate permease